MRPTLALLALALAPLSCGGAEPVVVQTGQPVVVDLDAKPAPSATPKAEAPEKQAEAEAPKAALPEGMIGLLNSGAGGDPNAPTAPWGRDDSLGKDPLSARGNMWGTGHDESFGAGGLGLSGIGEGGGGTGVGTIGLGQGTVGHGGSALPRIRVGSATLTGRLPPEVIHRIVRQSFGRYRLCYQSALTKNPKLEGRVTVKFTIGKDGVVTTASDGGSTIPDTGVISCVVRAINNLSFPSPEGGVVVVTYPLHFSPADAPPPAPAPAPPKPVAPAPAPAKQP